MSIFNMNTLRAIIVVSIALLSQTSTAATLKIATLSPEGSVWMKVLRKHAANIQQRTDGAVKLKFYPGGVMGDDKTVLRKMRLGQLHGAVFTAGGLVQVYKDITLYNLPMLFRSEAEVDFVRTALDEELLAGLRLKKFVGFGFAEVGFAYPMMQQPATTVAEVRTRKVWVPDNDPSAVRAFAAFDITPIPLPIADVLAGLQTGLVDSIASPPIGAIALQWHTQVEYAMELPLMYVYGLTVMGEKPFSRLTAAQQQVVEEELRAAVKAADVSARNDHNKAKSALTSQGIQWATPNEAKMSEWQTMANAASLRLVDEGYISRDLYQKVLALVKRYRAGDR
jgi:TRAP-type C4-dicarboxylate transport system substrate-binding protein